MPDERSIADSTTKTAPTTSAGATLRCRTLGELLELLAKQPHLDPDDADAFARDIAEARAVIEAVPPNSW
jgi:hypothetical protein